MSEQSGGAFHVRLDNFDGPFDLLLQLISRRRLDITEVALAQVTDEFVDHIGALGAQWDLEQTSHFLVVAATLLDLKAARLLPAGEVEDHEDLELLEARDLLFARLLQYRAFKQVAAWVSGRLDSEVGRLPRPGGLEEYFSGLMPEVVLDRDRDAFARLAATALTPREAAEVSLTHLHAPQVSVREEARVIVSRLRAAGRLTFDALTEGVDRLTVVARFLALLELFRQRAVAFDQPAPLATLTVVWTAPTGSGADGPDLDDDFDEFEAN